MTPIYVQEWYDPKHFIRTSRLHESEITNNNRVLRELTPLNQESHHRDL